MAILYFLGGHDPFLEGGVHITVRALREAGDEPRVLILPWGLERRSAGRRTEDLEAAFRDLGASAEVAWPEDGNGRLTTMLRSSDMVFLADGEIMALRSALRSSGIMECLRDHPGVIMGDAAGAAMMPHMALLPPDKYSSTYRMVPGLGLVDFSVVPRYRPQLDRHIMEASTGRTLFGIPQGSALMYGAGILSHSGTVHMFKGGRRTVLKEEAPI